MSGKPEEEDDEEASAVGVEVAVQTDAWEPEAHAPQEPL